MVYNQKMMSKKHSHIWLLCLSMILTVLAPMRALALSPDFLSTACADAVKKDCCAQEKSCCCSSAPVDPGNLESSAQNNHNSKFIAIKGTSRATLSDWLGKTDSTDNAQTSYELALQFVAGDLPLYLLKRSFLI